MSERDSAAPTTIAERIDAVQRGLPPKDGVRTRTGYASLDYFAELLGTNRQRIIDWKNGGEPDLRYRERLAELSKGQFTPDDFARPRAARAELEARVAELERGSVGSREDLDECNLALEELEAIVVKLDRTVASLRRRIVGIEQRLPSEVRGSAGEGSQK